MLDKFLTTYKQTHISVDGQQAQIECSRLWREIKKGKQNAATKSEAKNLKKGSIVNFFTKAATKKGELFGNVINTPIFIHQSSVSCLNTA